MSSTETSIFSRESATFLISRNTDIDCISIHNFRPLILFDSLKVVLINMVAIFMMEAKWATLVLLKKKTFSNKGYDVIIYAYEVNSNILPGNSNHTVGMVMLPKFDNSRISKRKVIITSIL